MKQSFWKTALVSIGALMLMAACSNEAAEPFEIDPETDTCANCNMSVADNKHATEIILTMLRNSRMSAYFISGGAEKQK